MIELDLISKRTYSTKTKMHDWQNYQDTLPFDREIRVQQDLHRSHYERFGKFKNTWSTTTGEFLNQIHLKRTNCQNNTTMMNVHSYIFDQQIMSDSWYEDNYRTTMKNSYISPFPKRFEKVKLQTGRFVDNKIYADFVENKFLDDSYHRHIINLQKLKSYRYASFNPILGQFTDGQNWNVRTPFYVRY